MLDFDIDYIWVPRELGGHSSELQVGQRPRLRWQRHAHEIEGTRGVQCTRVTHDAATGRGSATFRQIAHEAVPAHWMIERTPIELLDGTRVIAVGVIREIRVVETDGF